MFIVLHAVDLNEENSVSSSSDNFSIMKHIFLILRFLLQHGNGTLQCFVIAPLTQLVELCPKVFYPELEEQETMHFDYLESILNELVRFCNSKNRDLKVKSVVLLYKLLRTNITKPQHLLRFNVRVSVAIAKVIGEQESDTEGLQDCFGYMRKICGDDTLSEDAHLQIHKIIDLMETFIQQNELIKKNSTDPEMVVSLYHKIANTFHHSPKLRLTWLNNLTEVHYKLGNKCEAGLCKITMAALIVRYLKLGGQLKKLPSYFDLLFDSIAPHINMQKLLTPNENEQLDSSQVFKGENWNLNQLIEALEEAAKYFEEATFFELCLEVYSMLSLVHKMDRKFPKLVSTLEAHKDLVLRYTSEENPLDRLVPVYFRICFYGKKWEEELRGKMFIYKKDTRFNLSMMIKQMEDQYGTKYGKDNIVVLTQNKPIEEIESSLDDEKLYVQIAGVQPYTDVEESKSRVTFFQLNFNIDKFIFESSYSQTGSKISENDLGAQRKKKTIFKTKYPFPYIENRIEIVETYEIILSPIENAIELITSQTAKVLSQLEAVPTRVNLLQQTLQGSVVPMVNPGPMRICETFLSVSAIQEGHYKKEDIIKLINAMDIFIKKCGFAVRLNRYVIEEKHIKFAQMIESSYSQLSVTVEQAIADAKKVLDIKEPEKEWETDL
uniref:DOCKER domain-containing protein n=1 Tax=Arcella intermedia TaxID=1963864 RepID=A0A6B2KZ43_9EUKA